MIPTAPENATTGPQDPFQRGLVFARRGDFAGAAQAWTSALAERPHDVGLRVNLGAVLHALQRHAESLAQSDAAIALDPTRAEAFNNRCMTLTALHRLDAAIRDGREAIRLRPDYAEALNNLGVALHAAGRLDEAIDRYRDATRVRADYARAWSNLGFALQSLHRLDDAHVAFARALSINAALENLRGAALHLQMRRGDWRDLEPLRSALRSAIERGESAASPFALLGIFDSPALQRRAAEIAVRAWQPLRHESVNVSTAVPGATPADRSRRLRVAYFSADYFNHATTHLLAGLIEEHDRARFEIIGVSFGPLPGDAEEQRIRAAFDQFIDARQLDDRAVAALMRESGVDIAVDLKGYTQDARPGIFAARAAPLQVGYLGYPGTLGSGLLDYLIADHTLIPPEARAHYAEQIIYMPGSYQVNDRRRARPRATTARRDHGLPERGFVFCCFNNSFKITPEVFALWMHILRELDDAVLWLLHDNDSAVQQMREAATRAGVAAERLVFAARCATEQHLARHAHADLFLDTTPYNAHTTASDALWMGVPVMTQLGESFQARVAASLLRAVDLPELVTDSADAYCALAIDLARDPQRLESLRERLRNSRDSAVLFDTQVFARHLEQAFALMADRHARGLPPADLDLRAGLAS